MKITALKTVLLTSAIAILFTLTSFADPVIKDGFGTAVYEIPGELTYCDLAYWYGPLDEAIYSQRIRNATSYVASTGEGNCSAWVSSVYQAAGLGYFTGNACDLWSRCCYFTNINYMREGMLIAVRYSPTSELGLIYGHVGILIRNPYYKGTDLGRTINGLMNAVLALDEQLAVTTDAKTIRALQEQKDYYLSVAESLSESETDIYYYSGGVLIQADKNWNEKWLVADSSSIVDYTTLSKWLNLYNAYGTVAWGWGHR